MHLLDGIHLSAVSEAKFSFFVSHLYSQLLFMQEYKKIGTQGVHVSTACVCRGIEMPCGFDKRL